MPATPHGGTTVSGREGTMQIASVTEHQADKQGGTTGLIYRVLQWSLNLTVAPFAWGDSDSDGYTNRKATRADGAGNATVKLDSGKYLWNQFNEGDIAVLTLWVRKTATLERYWDFPRAMMDNIVYTVDSNTQEPIEVTFDFGADGRFYAPSETGQAVRTLAST